MPRASVTEAWAPRAAARALACAVAVLAVATLAPSRGSAQHAIAGPDSGHPRIRYADSLDSVNHRCMVSKAKLNPAMRAVYVNGDPVGFC